MSNHLKIETRSRLPLRYGVGAKLAFFRSQIALLFQRWQRGRAIAHLERLDDKMLADIGISRAVRFRRWLTDCAANSLG